eukprot:SAG22_NODE_5181_length_1069_cov_0.702062_1_plen_32_part_10
MYGFTREGNTTSLRLVLNESLKSARFLLVRYG